MLVTCNKDFDRAQVRVAEPIRVTGTWLMTAPLREEYTAIREQRRDGGMADNGSPKRRIYSDSRAAA